MWSNKQITLVCITDPKISSINKNVAAFSACNCDPVYGASSSQYYSPQLRGVMASNADLSTSALARYCVVSSELHSGCVPFQP